jgi:uncharacterized protein with HEPN domain
MTPHRVFLEHILESILLIEKYTTGVEERDFVDDVQLQDSVYRRLEIIGEAVKNIPAEYRMRHKQVPWKRVAGLRDVLIHQYFGVDARLTWSLLQEGLPALRKQIEDLLQSD